MPNITTNHAITYTNKNSIQNTPFVLFVLTDVDGLKRLIGIELMGKGSLSLSTKVLLIFLLFNRSFLFFGIFSILTFLFSYFFFFSHPATYSLYSLYSLENSRFCCCCCCLFVFFRFFQESEEGVERGKRPMG